MAPDTERAGLRERKRVRTRRAIAAAALELFDRQGFQDTTIAQIAEAADVSPRTVSGYFSHKEDLAFPDSEKAFATLEQRLRERPAEETAADALRDWIEAWLRDHAPPEEERRVRRRIIAGDEGLRAYEHRFMVRVQDALAVAIARDLGAGPRELEPRMAAAATLTAFQLVGEELEPASEEDALAAIDRALLFIGGGIRALRG